MQLVDKSQLLDSMYESLLQARRAELTAQIGYATKMIVQAGPFQGMRVRPEVAWGDGDIATKLLGIYEQELHIAIQHFSSKQYGAIVNVGCAEGYYAVGLSRLFPAIPTLAFDYDQKAQTLCLQAALENGRGSHVAIRGACSPNDLKVIAAAYKPLLCVIDCEGYELELLSEEIISGALASSDLIVECHDFMQPEITPQLIRRFSETHILVNVACGARNPNAIPMLTPLKDYDRWMLVSEGRPRTMNWLICEAKNRPEPE